MSKKDGNTTEIKAVAEVRMGNFVAKFTEENLIDLKDVAEFARDSAMESVKVYDEFIIGWYNENHKDADKCMRLLDGLRGYVSLFELIGKIEVKYEPAK